MEQSFKKEFSSRYDMHSGELKELYLDELGDYNDLLIGTAVNKFSINIAPGSFMWLVCDSGEEL